MSLFFLFVFKQKTAYELRISDWSSDVCSSDLFGEVEERSWRWTRPMTRDDLFAMARSRSYVLTAEPAERARIEQALSDLCDDIGAVGDAVVDLPYVTRAFRTIRP